MTTKTTSKPSGLTLLREPFPANQVSQLPKVTCRDCSQKNCSQHNPSKCGECGAWISSAHIHLLYVGHAALTDRLLDADPEWTWEPLAFGPDGLPVIDRNGGLWIRLTVAGVTRLGYGDAQGKTGGNAVKEAIGDALRNAGMRFGAALDLWHKGDLHVDHDEPAARPAQRGPVPPEENVWQTPAVTDREWFTDWQARVADCTDLSVLRGLYAEVGGQVKVGKLADDDAATARQLVEARAAEISATQQAGAA